MNFQLEKGLTCLSVFKSECVRRSFAEGAAITECAVGVICRAGEQLVKSFIEWNRVL